jgi:hypothetical protein
VAPRMLTQGRCSFFAARKPDSSALLSHMYVPLFVWTVVLAVAVMVNLGVQIDPDNRIARTMSLGVGFGSEFADAGHRATHSLCLGCSGCG